MLTTTTIQHDEDSTRRRHINRMDNFNNQQFLDEHIEENGIVSLPLPDVKPQPMENWDKEMRSPTAEIESNEDLESRRAIPQFIRVSHPQAPFRRFIPLQQWECAVTEINEESLWAELHDLTNPTNPPEEAELFLENFSMADRALLRVGSVFYWVIGRDTTPSGQIRNVSELRLKRTPRWTQRKIESIHAKGADLFREFSENEQIQTASNR
jgi:hypothetical protein